MRRRFPDEVKNQMFGFYLISKHIRKLTPDIIEQLFQAFPDLTNFEELKCELDRRKKVVTMQNEVRLQEPIRLADKDLYPYVFAILQQRSFLPCRLHLSVVRDPFRV